MGMLIDGVWHDDSKGFASADGAFHRQEAVFRHWITQDGAPGPTGEGGFVAEPVRYHLYVSLACPWAHRTLIVRALKGLEPVIGVSVVSPLMFDDGWTFARDFPGSDADPIHGARFLRDVYLAVDPKMTGRVTVPLLYDRQRDTIVSNESADIVRMFDSAFDGLTGCGTSLYPEPLRDEIDAVNARVYDAVNNGVYKAGFATTQDAYEAAVGPLFGSLGWLEQRLSRQRYLVGDRVTEADWRLFTTTVRFDAVYHGHFKCNLRRIEDYPNLLGWMRELAQMPGVAQTIDMAHIKHHYYRSHPSVNPTRIVPVGEGPDLMAPHGREARRVA
jgi:putative glutathione S-transferase